MRVLATIPRRAIRAFLRARSLRRIRNLPIPGSLLFLCHGNIFRSAYAAGYFRSLVPEGLRSSLRIDSAGFVNPGRACPPVAIEVAGARGVDLREHRSSLLTPERVEAAELIVVMDPRHAVALRTRYGLDQDQILILGDLDTDLNTPRSIPDPYGLPADLLHQSFDRISRCTTVLAESLILDRIPNNVPGGNPP